MSRHAPDAPVIFPSCRQQLTARLACALLLAPVGCGDSGGDETSSGPVATTVAEHESSGAGGSSTAATTDLGTAGSVSSSTSPGTTGTDEGDLTGTQGDASESETAAESGDTEDPADCLDFEVWCAGRCVVPSFDAEHCGASGDCLGDQSGSTCPADQSCVEGSCAMLLDFSDPRELFAVEGQATELALVNTAKGDRVLIWRTYQGRHGSLWAASARGDVWSEPELLVAGGLRGDVSVTATSLATGGDVVLLTWILDTAGDTSVHSRRFTAQAGWTDDVLVSDDAAGDHSLTAVVNSVGDGYVIWHAIDQLDWRPRLARWPLATSAWRPFIDPGALDDSSIDPVIAVDGHDDLTLAWRSIADLTTVHAVRMDAELTTLWPAQQVVPIFESIPHLALVADAFGDATMVWGDQGMFQDMQAIRFDVGQAAWSAPQSLPSGDSIDSPHTPVLVPDPAGNVTALWSEANENEGNHLWANRYERSSGRWQGAQKLGGRWFGGWDVAGVADTTGQVTVVWWSPDRDRQHGIRAARYDVSVGQWSPASLIDDPALGNSFEPQLSIADDGVVTALWAQRTSNARTIFRSARFMPGRR